MSDKQETVADIVREMLDYDGLIEEFACRIEVAYMREMAALAKASGESGAENDILRQKPITKTKE